MLEIMNNHSPIYNYQRSSKLLHKQYISKEEDPMSHIRSHDFEVAEKSTVKTNRRARISTRIIEETVKQNNERETGKKEKMKGRGRERAAA